MAEAGLPVPPEHLMPGGRYEAGGCEIARRYVALERRPTALHIVNDAQVSGFVAELYRLGFRVPQYVSVIGTDDIAAAAEQLGSDLDRLGAQRAPSRTASCRC